MSDDEERVTKPFKFVTGKQRRVKASGQQLMLCSRYVPSERPPGAWSFKESMAGSRTECDG